MNNSPASQLDPAAAGTVREPLIAPHAWIRIAILAVVFLALHSNVLSILYSAGKNNDNWSHIFLIPPISLYLIFRQRRKLARMQAHRDWKGLLFFVPGLLLYGAGIQIGSTMIMGYAMILELFGLVWFFVGWPMMKILWLPILYLVFGVKFTYLYTQISLVLQHVAASAGTFVLQIGGIPLGIDADAAGAVVQVYHQGRLIEPPLNVEEACSGLRSLMALGALSVAMAYLDDRPLWTRILIVGCAVPVAVLVNILRIAITGFLYPYHPQLCRGEVHELTGLLMLVPAILLLFLIMRICDWVRLEDDDEMSRFRI